MLERCHDERSPESSAVWTGLDLFLYERDSDYLAELILKSNGGKSRVT